MQLAYVFLVVAAAAALWLLNSHQEGFESKPNKSSGKSNETCSHMKGMVKHLALGMQELYAMGMTCGMDKYNPLDEIMNQQSIPDATRGPRRTSHHRTTARHMTMNPGVNPGVLNSMKSMNTVLASPTQMTPATQLSAVGPDFAPAM